MKYIFIFLFFCANLFSAELLFEPYTANIFEPRIGSFYQPRDEKLRLDIGASFDVYKKIDTDGKIFEDYAFGADFFTYTRLRHSGSFKFPVETSDYYFGVNFSARELFSSKLETRIRLAHISSHLVDGYTLENDITQFRQAPFTYSHEFIDWSFAYPIENLLSENDKLRPYLGVWYNFSKVPDEIPLVNLQLGFDYEIKLLERVNFKAGADFKALDFQFCEDNSLITTQIGPEFMFNNSVGLFVGYYGYAGRSFHGMFFQEKDFYNGFGFQIIYY